jgi:phosphatidate cytidylyltransferase
MKRILTAAILVPLVLLGVFRAPLWLLLLLLAAVALAATWEYLGLLTAIGLEPFQTLSCGAMAVIFLLPLSVFIVVSYRPLMTDGSMTSASMVFRGVVNSSFLVLLLTPFLLLTAATRKQNLRSALPGAAMAYLALPYIGLPLLLLAVLREQPGGWVYLLFLFLAVWIGDTAAMYVGKSMGRHKLAPRISPGKTVEGTVASVVFAVAACCLFAYFIPEIAQWLERSHLLTGATDSLALEAYGRGPLWLAAPLAALINAAAQLGDLLESALKRGAGVKDSGTMLPGHGGMLDRIDALLMAAPVAFILLSVYGEKLVYGDWAR